MKAQQGSGLEDDGRADQPTRAQEPGTKPEEQAVGGAKIGRSAAGPLQDQELLLQEDTLSENGPGSASSQENGQSGQQVPQQYNRIFHGQVACAALDSGAREPDRRCEGPQLRIRHVQALPGKCWQRAKGRRKAGRPALDAELVSLIGQMSRVAENPSQPNKRSPSKRGGVAAKKFPLARCDPSKRQQPVRIWMGQGQGSSATADDGTKC